MCLNLKSLLFETLGETTRRGFYVYDDKRRANPDPEIKKYIEKAREMSGAIIDPKVTVSSLSIVFDCDSRNASIRLTCGIEITSSWQNCRIRILWK